MKKRIFALLVAMLMLVSVLALTSCDVMSMLPDSITSLIPGFNGGDETCADGHADADGDEICDNCGASVPAQDPGEDEPGDPSEELPEEPEREPTYQIKFNFYGWVYSDKRDEDGALVMGTDGLPQREGVQKDTLVYTLDVLQNQAPTAEQLAEIPGITYGGISVIGWYDSPELKNEVDFTEVLTADKNVYAKLRIDEPDKEGNQYCGDNATWKVSSKGVLEIKGKGAMYDFTYPELAPWYYDESGARRQITGVDISNGITHIGSYSFFNMGVKASDIDIGSGVKSIGMYAFAYSQNLKSLPEIDGVETIGYGAFMGCRNITAINIPDSVVTIDGYAFFGCKSFDRIVLGKNVKTIGEYAFNQDGGTTHEYIYYLGTAEQYAEITVKLGNMKFDPYGAYLYYYTEADSPEAKVAGQYWVYDRFGVPQPTSYTLRYYGDGQSKFPLFTDFVFIDSDGVGRLTEQNMTNMRNVSYRGYKFEKWKYGDNYVTDAISITKHADFKGERGVVIGDNATYNYIGAPDYTLEIKGTGSTWDFQSTGDTVYYNMTIKKVVFEEGITRLGSNVLAGLKDIVTIELPASVKEVDPRAFASCARLAAIYYMGENISDCKGLDSLEDTKANVYAKGTSSSIGKDGAFWMDNADGTRVAWAYKDGVLTVGGVNEMPDFEEGSAPWLKYENVKEITFASNIISIGEYAFAGMKGVEKITIPLAVKSIPRNAFEGSDYWNNEANWKDGALMAGTHLLAFDVSKMPAGVDFATIPQATKVIIADAFANCGSIKTLVMPAVINSIDKSAFYGLTGVEIIYYYGQNVNAWNALPDEVDALTDNGNGAKVLYRATTDKCSACSGKINLPCERCGETVNSNCKSCRGEGDINGDPCPSCGWTINPGCTECEGKGKECATCNGTGKIASPENYWHMVNKVPTPWNEET